MEKSKLEKNLKRLEIYKDLITSYDNGVSCDTIKDMMDYDYIKYMRKLKYSFIKIKDSYNYNNQTVIENEDDLVDAKKAYEYFTSKIKYRNKHNEDRDNFYDLVLKQKEEFLNEYEGMDLQSVVSLIEYDINLFEENSILERMIDSDSKDSLEAFSKQQENVTAIKSKKEKDVKKLALELIKKENN